MEELRIVLADDHELVRAGVRSLINATPGLCVVGEASDGAGAVECACRLLPDVVVLDVTMPGMGGAAATEEIVRRCPAARVLALTAHEDHAHLSRLMQAGASGYVLKRGAADELVRAIRTVASGSTYVDPVLAGSVLRAPEPLPAPAPTSLSEREEEVVRRMAWGESNKQIAAGLGISTKTVETYKARIADKLGLRARTDIVRYALRQGWLSES